MKKKKEVFYKIIDTKRGHHGFFYKLGINTDPSTITLKNVQSCAPGALYFVRKENLASWCNYGNRVAILQPVGAYKLDEDGGKYKAKSLNVLEIITFQDAAIQGILPSRFIGKKTYQELKKLGLKMSDIVDALWYHDQLKEIERNIKNLLPYLSTGRKVILLRRNKKFAGYMVRNGYNPSRNDLGYLSKADFLWYMKTHPNEVYSIFKEYV